MSTKTYLRPTIDEAGNIWLHARGGMAWIVQIGTIDESGNPGPLRDLAGVPLEFEVAGLWSVPLEPDADPTKRLLLLDPDKVEDVFGREFDFALIDRSGPTPTPCWWGKIRSYGFTDAAP